MESQICREVIPANQRDHAQDEAAFAAKDARSRSDEAADRIGRVRRWVTREGGSCAAPAAATVAGVEGTASTSARDAPSLTDAPALLAWAPTQDSTSSRQPT